MMENKKQTAVEWLIEQLKERGYAGEFPPHLLFDHAKQMEKEQIIKARVTAPLLSSINESSYKQEADQYYNETYGQK